MRQEFISDTEAEALAIMRKVEASCSTSLSDREKITLYAMALARNEGLTVGAARLLGTDGETTSKTSKATRALLKRINDAMRFVWR